MKFEEEAQKLQTICNAHNALVECLHAQAEHCRMALAGEWGKGDEGFQAALEHIEAALAKVEVK